jgi:hypothetical protein
MSIATDPATTPDDGTTWEPRGHPVRWAVAVVSLIAAALVASIWFGALTPLVDVEVGSWTSEAVGDNGATLVLEVSNEAHAGVRLVSAGGPLPGLEPIATELGSGERLGDGNSIVLDPGETARVTLRYRVTDCAALPGDPPAIPLVLRTPLGLTRTVTADVVDDLVGGDTSRWTDDLLPRC